MKKIIFIALSLLWAIPSFAAVELDADSNGGTDISKGGTNSTTAANAAEALGVGVTDNPSFNSVHASGGNVAAANAQVTKKWITGLSYTANLTSVIYGGKHYICTSTHTAGASTEPGTGADWATVWTVGVLNNTITKDDTAPATCTDGDIWVDTNGTSGSRLATCEEGSWVAQAGGGGGGYTNLTSFIAQTPWRLFYSNTDGDVVELGFGADGEYLKSNGASLAPTWATPSGAAHDAVTLSTDLASNLLGLSTQQLTLDSQTANYIFAAPNGSAGAPVFRALVDTDIPDTITASNYLTTGGTAANSSQLESHAASYFQVALTNPLVRADIDDAPVNGEVTGPISSNWAYDHAAAADPHTGYLQESAISANGLSLIGAANYAAMKTLLDTDDIQTLTGVAAGTAHLGTFTGTTIADSSTIKTALQSVETSLETKASVTGSDTYVQINDGGVFGSDAGLTYNKATDTLAVNGTVTAAAWASTAADGARYSEIPNTVTLTSTPTLGRISWLTDRFWLANGTNWTTRYLLDSSFIGVSGGVQLYDTDLTTWAGVTPGTGVATALSNALNGTSGLVTYGNAAGTAAVLTGYSSGAGVVAATDTILQAVNKLNGNTAAKANSADAVLTSSTQIPNGANPTTDAAGEVAIDSSAGAGQGLRAYGAVGFTLPAYHTKCTTINAATASSDFMVETMPYAVTIRAAHANQIGATNVIGHFDECDSAGANCATIDSTADITATTTKANDDGTLSNPSIDSGDVISWHTTSVSGTNTQLMVCIDYTVDQVN